MRNLNLLLLMILTYSSMACVAQDSQKYNWKEIKEFKFYGRNNPIEKEDLIYVLADVTVVKELLTNSKKSEGYFPKGAQNYAQIIFNDSRVITIQILSGLPAPIRVIEGKLFDDDWFEFDEKTAMKWIEYIHQLNEQLTK